MKGSPLMAPKTDPSYQPQPPLIAHHQPRTDCRRCSPLRPSCPNRKSDAISAAVSSVIVYEPLRSRIDSFPADGRGNRVNKLGIRGRCSLPRYPDRFPTAAVSSSWPITSMCGRTRRSGPNQRPESSNLPTLLNPQACPYCRQS